MASVSHTKTDFEAYIQERRLMGTTGASTQANPAFISLEVLQEYWDNRHVKQALGAHPPPTSQIIIKILGYYLQVFSILVLIEKPHLIHEISQYTSLDDDHLPFYVQRDVPKYWPSNTDDFGRFYQMQWQFCPHIFKSERLLGDTRFDKDLILPIKTMRLIREGGNAKIYKIELHAEYNDLCDKPGTKFVLKQYRDDQGKKHYENETKAFRMLGHSNKHLENMVRFYGSWEQGETYNILLEYADGGTLLDFFKRTPPPTETNDIITFWTRLLHIINALGRIHDLQHYDEGVYQGIHQDIMLSNILVFSTPGSSVYDVTFKLADLGLSQFKLRPRANEDVIAKDEFGALMYSAPECCRLGSLQQSALTVTSAIDIWSLGCVFSEAAAWTVLGNSGIEEYAKNRYSESLAELIQAGYGGCFHNGLDMLNAVPKMHKRLIGVRRVSDPVIEQVVQLIEDMMATAPKDRLTVAQVSIKADRILKQAKDKEFPEMFRTIEGSVRQLHEAKRNRSETEDSAPITSSYDENEPSPLSLQNGHFSYPTSPHLPTSSRSPAMPIQKRSPGNMQYLENMPESSAMRDLNILRSSFANLNPARNESLSRNESSMSPNAIEAPMRIFPHYAPVQNGFSSPLIPAPNLWTVDQALEPSTSNHDPLNTIPPVAHFPSSPATLTRVINYNQTSTYPVAEANDQRQNKSHDFVSVEMALQWRKSPAALGGQRSLIEDNLGNLKDRDIAILIDDSKSMDPHQDELIRVVSAITGIVEGKGRNGMDLCFTSIPSERFHYSTMKSLLQKIQNRRGKGDCNMKMALNNMLEPFMAGLDKNYEKSRTKFWFSRRSDKPKQGLSIYVFTTGIWQPDPHHPLCGVEEPIRLVVSKLKDRHLDCKVGIQFIRFGNDQVGKDRLDRLDSKQQLQEICPEIDMDIVDTTSSDGNFLKMLYGAMDRYWDDDKPPPMTHHLSQRSITRLNGHVNGFQST